MCLSSMVQTSLISPLTVSKVTPDSSLGSISDFRSGIAKTETAKLLALLVSGANELD
ncbi:hypothetical protein HanPSC8_Chr13g0578011 [Helianthus annuus]|nr:hypothetical protein HanPSC8_Chr13g0578011 [Helianthus annuus]